MDLILLLFYIWWWYGCCRPNRIEFFFLSITNIDWLVCLSFAWSIIIILMPPGINVAKAIHKLAIMFNNNNQQQQPSSNKKKISFFPVSYSWIRHFISISHFISFVVVVPLYLTYGKISRSLLIIFVQVDCIIMMLILPWYSLTHSQIRIAKQS